MLAGLRLGRRYLFGRRLSAGVGNTELVHILHRDRKLQRESKRSERCWAWTHRSTTGVDSPESLIASQIAEPKHFLCVSGASIVEGDRGDRVLSSAVATQAPGNGVVHRSICAARPS